MDREYDQAQNDQRLTLTTLFNRFLQPEAISAETYARKFRQVIRWLRLYLEREPIVADLNDTEMLAKFFRYALDRGQSFRTVRSYRQRINRLQGYSVAKGLLREFRELPAIVGTAKPRTTAHGLPRLDTLEHYFEHTYKPSIFGKPSAQTRHHYEAALGWFSRYREGRTELAVLGQEELDGFQRYIEHAGLSSGVTERYVKFVRKVLVHAGRIYERPSRNGKREAVDAARNVSGSLEWFLFDDYVFSRKLVESSVTRMIEHIRAFGRFLGRAPMVADLERQNVNRYFSHLETIGRAKATIKSARCHLLALWRAAWDAGLLADLPRGIRRVRLACCVECWTPAEVAAILRAVDLVFVREDGSDKTFSMSGVSKRKFLRSLILAAWDGGQRLGDTLGLQTDQLDVLSDGSAEYVLQQRKSGRYVRFVLRPTTVEAIVDCVRSGKGSAVNRKEPWRWVCAKNGVQQMFRRVVLAVQAADGIRYGSFQWLRRASVTARECIESGAGTLAAGHSAPRVTLMHYIDTRQLPAAPLPPDLCEQSRSPDASNAGRNDHENQL